MCDEQYEQPLISCHCYVRETSMNIQDVQRLDMMLFGNVSLGNDQLSEEEILVVLLQEYNPEE